jgi:hypothetical protein
MSLYHVAVGRDGKTLCATFKKELAEETATARGGRVYPVEAENTFDARRLAETLCAEDRKTRKTT